MGNPPRGRMAAFRALGLLGGLAMEAMNLIQCPAAPMFAYDRRPRIWCNPSSGSSSVCRAIGASGTGRQDLYQPFRPPPNSKNTGNVEQDLETLRNRQGAWYQYAVVIPRLTTSGYTLSQIDEATGVTGVEQNQLVVAAQVRGTLESGGMPPDKLASFDSLDGSSVLYELRVLSAAQRLSAAMYVIERNMDARGARDVARAIKDFDRRRREMFWDRFSSSLPGDCLAFWWYRQSKEFSGSGRASALHKAVEFATSDRARQVLSDLSGAASGTPASTSPVEQDGTSSTSAPVSTMVSVVRLDMGETAGLLMIPVANPDETSIGEAPETSQEGPFRIHKSLQAWKGAWVPLPGWKPILQAKSPLAISFPNGAIVATRHKEEMLLIIDRAVSQGDFKAQSAYLVAAQGSGELSLRSGGELVNDTSLKTLGEVVLALSPEE